MPSWPVLLRCSDGRRLQDFSRAVPGGFVQLGNAQHFVRRSLRLVYYDAEPELGGALDSLAGVVASPVRPASLAIQEHVVDSRPAGDRRSLFSSPHHCSVFRAGFVHHPQSDGWPGLLSGAGTLAAEARADPTWYRR